MAQKLGHIGMGRSSRRSEVWSFLRTYMKANEGRPPTVREIKQGAGLRSLRHVQRTLADLEREGLIRRMEFGRTRGIGIVGARYLLPDEPAETEGQP